MSSVADDSPSGPRHDDQARDLTDTIYELQRTLWAFQGLGEVMHPDTHLEGVGRGNLAMLISVLTERFETLLEEAEERWRSTPAQAQEDADAD